MTPGRIAIGRLGHIVTTVQRNIGRRENAFERTNISLHPPFYDDHLLAAAVLESPWRAGTDSRCPPKKPVPPATGAGGRVQFGACDDEEIGRASCRERV